MNYTISEIIKKELIPNSLRKTAFNMFFYYYEELKDWVKKKIREEEEKENQGEK